MAEVNPQRTRERSDSNTGYPAIVTKADVHVCIILYSVKRKKKCNYEICASQIKLTLTKFIVR